MGAPLWSGGQKTKHGMEISLLSSEEEIQKTAFRQENHVNALLGHAWTYYGAFQAHGQTVNSANYCAMLRNELKLAICKKRRGMLSKKVLLHHDNARSHTAAATVETVQQLGFIQQQRQYRQCNNWASYSSSDSKDSAATGLQTFSTSSLQPGFGAERLSHLRSSEGGVARSQIRFQWGSKGSHAHLASRAAEKLLLRRNTETSWTI